MKRCLSLYISNVGLKNQTKKIKGCTDDKELSKLFSCQANLAAPTLIKIPVLEESLKKECVIYCQTKNQFYSDSS